METLFTRRLSGTAECLVELRVKRSSAGNAAWLEHYNEYVGAVVILSGYSAGLLIELAAMAKEEEIDAAQQAVRVAQQGLLEHGQQLRAARDRDKGVR